MGIARNAARLMFEEAKKAPFSGAVLQLGRQDIYLSYEQLIADAKSANCQLNDNVQPTFKFNPFYSDTNTVDDITFFKLFGFETVSSLDASDYEKSTYIEDLNRPIPDMLHNKFDVIYDGGTFEHVFHIPQAFSNVHAMLKTGGKVIHATPVFNYVDHGFYSFSPGLFFDYYMANKYEIVSGHLVGEKVPYSHENPVNFFSYKPGDLDSLSNGGLNRDSLKGSDVLWLFFSAIKTSESTGHVIPQQGFYVNEWSKHK